MTAVATLIAWGATIWLLIGLVLMPWMLWKGLQRQDALVSQSSWGFRLIMIPSIVLLWPLLLKAPKRPFDDTPHKKVAS